METIKGFLGSKSADGAYQAIIANMPAHDTYIETHLGSGAIMLKKPRSLRSIGIDIDPKVIDHFKSNSHFELYNCDCISFLKSFDFSSAGRVLIYCDPPYLHSTRTSKKRYRFEYSIDDHKKLIQTLSTLALPNVYIIISGYPSDLYDNLLPNWRTLEFQCMSHGGVRTEKLWFSFNGLKPHWIDYAGSNFTDRQRIKRKAERWAKNYRSLPPNERLAIMAALLECDSI